MSSRWHPLRFLVPFACLVAIVPVSLTSNTPGVARSTDDAFTVDVNAGADLQQSMSGKAAPDVLFTNEGGVPYAMPYDAQRIGSDGGISLSPARNYISELPDRPAAVTGCSLDRVSSALCPGAYS